MSACYYIQYLLISVSLHLISFCCVNGIEFHLASDQDSTADVSINPLTSAQPHLNSIYIFGPQQTVSTEYKSFVDRLNINNQIVSETASTQFLSFSDDPISFGYCQFGDYMYYLSSPNTINKLDISDPYSAQSVAKWYISRLSHDEWSTITCNSDTKEIYILQNNDLIVFVLSDDQNSYEIDRYELDIDDDIDMDGHSAVFYDDILYIIHGSSQSKLISMIDLYQDMEWIDANMTALQNCYDYGLNTFVENDQIYLLCQDYIKIYNIMNDSIQITSNSLNIPRYHASVQVYDIDHVSFKVFIFGGRSNELNGSLSFEYTDTIIRDGMSLTESEDTNDDTNDASYSPHNNKSMIHNTFDGMNLLPFGSGLGVVILCILLCYKIRRGRRMRQYEMARNLERVPTIDNQEIEDGMLQLTVTNHIR